MEIFLFDLFQQLLAQLRLLQIPLPFVLQTLVVLTIRNS